MKVKVSEVVVDNVNWSNFLSKIKKCDEYIILDFRKCKRIEYNAMKKLLLLNKSFMIKNMNKEIKEVYSKVSYDLGHVMTTGYYINKNITNNEISKITIHKTVDERANWAKCRNCMLKEIICFYNSKNYNYKCKWYNIEENRCEYI